jgi:hypothetical protein
VDAIGHPGSDAGQPTVWFDAAGGGPSTDLMRVSMDRSSTNGSEDQGGWEGRPSGVAAEQGSVVGENIIRFPGGFLRFFALTCIGYGVLYLVGLVLWVGGGLEEAALVVLYLLLVY